MAYAKASLTEFFSQNSQLSREQVIEVALLFTERNWKKNQFLLTEGMVSNEWIFLESGFVRTFAIDFDGREVTTGFITGDQVIIEVASFFQRAATVENIQALVDSKGWVVSFEDFQTLFHTIPAFREFGRSLLVKGYVSLKQRMLSVITDSAEKRYEHLIMTRPDIFKTVPLKFIASYLGITDTSLSRIRKELTNK